MTKRLIHSYSTASGEALCAPALEERPAFTSIDARHVTCPACRVRMREPWAQSELRDLAGVERPSRALAPRPS